MKANQKFNYMQSSDPLTIYIQKGEKIEGKKEEKIQRMKRRKPSFLEKLSLFHRSLLSSQNILNFWFLLGSFTSQCCEVHLPPQPPWWSVPHICFILFELWPPWRHRSQAPNNSIMKCALWPLTPGFHQDELWWGV